MGQKSAEIEQTLILVKPDAMQRGLAGEVISRIERKGLRIVAMRLLQVDAELAGRHYEAHTDKPFFGSLVEFILHSIVATILGEDISSLLCRLISSFKMLIYPARQN